MSYRPGTAPTREAAMQLSDGAGVKVPQAAARALPVAVRCDLFHLPPGQQEGPFTGPSRSSRTDPVLVRNRLSAPHHGGRAQPASVPPLRAGEVS